MGFGAGHGAASAGLNWGQGCLVHLGFTRMIPDYLAVTGSTHAVNVVSV